MSNARWPKQRWLELRLPVAVANALAAMALFLVALAPALVGAGAASTTWTFDEYDSRAVLYQDPDYNACASAAAEIMLNLAAYQSIPDFLDSQHRIATKPDADDYLARLAALGA